jgi:hypothetical protein
MHKIAKAAVRGALCATLLLAVNTRAQEEENPLEASVDLAVFSAYVWRGQVLTEDVVAQPSLTVSKYGFTLNWWGNFNFDDDATGDEYEFSEHDISISYGTTCPLTGADLSLGIVNYDFPNVLVDDGAGNNSLVMDTVEAQLIIAFSEVLLAPTLLVAYDFKEGDGFYFNFGLSHSLELAEKVSLGLSASIGFADSDYNTYYFGVDDSAFNDANIGVELPIALTENLTITPSLTYTFLVDSDIEDAAEGLYLDKDQLWGGVTASLAL